MCERTSAMFAIRACRVFCMKNFQAYPDQCGVPGKTIVNSFLVHIILIRKWVWILRNPKDPPLL